MRTILAGAVATALAVQAIARISNYQDNSIRPWIQAVVAGELGSPDPGTLRSRSAEILPILIEEMNHGNPVLEQTYTVLCSKLPNALSRRLPPHLKSEMRRANAAALVGQLGPAGKPAVPSLVKLLQDDVADANAAISLGKMGPAAREAVPALILALQEKRPFAATALSKLGPPASAARISLEDSARTGPEWLRQEATRALRQIREANLKNSKQAKPGHDPRYECYADHSAA